MGISGPKIELACSYMKAGSLKIRIMNFKNKYWWPISTLVRRTIWKSLPMFRTYCGMDAWKYWVHPVIYAETNKIRPGCQNKEHVSDKSLDWVCKEVWVEHNFHARPAFYEGRVPALPKLPPDAYQSSTTGAIANSTTGIVSIIWPPHPLSFSFSTTTSLATTNFRIWLSRMKQKSLFLSSIPV